MFEMWFSSAVNITKCDYMKYLSLYLKTEIFNAYQMKLTKYVNDYVIFGRQFRFGTSNPSPVLFLENQNVENSR